MKTIDASPHQSFYSLPKVADVEDILLCESRAYRWVADSRSDLPSTESLLAASRDPNEIAEFSAIAKALEVKRALVVRMVSPDTLIGFCFSSHVYPELEAHGIHCLIAMDESKLPSSSSLESLFLHELAHVYAGEGHDWKFLTVLNVARMRSGLRASQDPYDMRDGMGDEDDAGFDEGVMELYARLAQKLSTTEMSLYDVGTYLSGMEAQQSISPQPRQFVEQLLSTERGVPEADG